MLKKKKNSKGVISKGKKVHQITQASVKNYPRMQEISVGF